MRQEHMEDEITFKRLIEDSAGGDATSFRLLTERFDERLFAYILARTGSRDDALDALQEVCIDLWQVLQKFAYRSDAQFYGLLYTITKRRLYKIWEKRKELNDFPVADADSFADASMEKPEERLALEGAIEKLDETSREIILLKYWSRYSFSEIGAMLSVEEGAVRVRHHRALSKLQASLTDYA